MNDSSSIPIDALEDVESAADLERLLADRPQLEAAGVAEQLHAEILSGVVVDPKRARRLSRLVRWLAEFSRDEYALALADRCDGHVEYSASSYSTALRCYEAAAQRFEMLGRDVDVARTLTGAIQSLIYLGLNETALKYAERARAVFESEDDKLRLARLDSNVGNIYYRQDRYSAALNYYQRALERLVALKRQQDAAAVLSNMAVAYTGMGEFHQAAAAYAQSRQIADREGLTLLSAELDYNIAYLHFLRGNHTRALALYRDARSRSESAGDQYHAALCDLDQAEIYLQLNLIEESLHLSRRAASRFEQLGMNYERAKALTFSGIAENSRQKTRHAVVLFAEARRLFATGRNPVWRANVDFYRSILLNDLGQTGTAVKLARRAECVFESEKLQHRAALVKLLRAEILLNDARLADALQQIDDAVRRLIPNDHPMVFFHADYLHGRILRMQNDPKGALSAFSLAAERLESIRCRLAGDEFKIEFVRDKLDVYSQLIRLHLEARSRKGHEAVVFELVEKSKSRSLADRISLLGTNGEESLSDALEFSTLREKLNALYREVESRETDHRNPGDIQARIGLLESRLSELVRQQSLQETVEGSTVDWTPAPLEAVVEALQPRTQLLEYFVSEDRLWAGVIGAEGTAFKDLGPFESVQAALSLFTFQITRPRNQLNAAASQELTYAATLSHLQALYRKLIAPIESLIDAAHLIIVPHRLLHCLPFHALHDGSSFLIDRSSVSYAPSATVFQLCKRRAKKNDGRSLILGVPDEKSPSIAVEIESVSQLLPHPSIFMAEKATASALFEHAGSSRYIHIASHGQFRSDNPMFSSVRLGDGPVTVLDLYRLKLNAELVTLSGCSTGAGVVIPGDELVGLARGLMHAGARAVLLASWEVDDPTTAVLMHRFYEGLRTGQHCAAALRNAMMDVKQDWQDPYYWAPFALTGYALELQKKNG